jgi:hypothetical protein
MLQDQLNHALEMEITRLDTEILKNAQRILENRKLDIWVIGYLVLFFLLHVQEVYARRFLIWSHCYLELV